VRQGLIGLVLAAWLGLCGPAFAQSGPLSNWAAVIVAGDWHAHSGKPSAVFDNARRDLAKAFVAAGFAPEHIRQFSVHEAAGSVLASRPDVIYAQLKALAGQAPGGCLLYFTSHGDPEGVLIDDKIMAPGVLAAILDETCGARPTVVVVAACFSGVFVDPLAGPNRMVLTAARADRPSFGCGEEDRYTYFDTCILQALPGAHDFVALGRAAQACVARREKDEREPLASEPQMDVGVALRPMLPLYAFAKPPPLSRPTPAP
jgi:hypothetical protein